MGLLKRFQDLGGDIRGGDIEVFEIGEMSQGLERRTGDLGHGKIDEAERGDLTEMLNTDVVHGRLIEADLLEAW